MRNAKNIKYIIISLVIIIAIILAILSEIKLNKNETTASSLDIDVEIEYDDEDEKISWQDEDYQDITLDKSDVTITKAGTYHIQGELSDGNITVNVSDSDIVRLVLDGVNITCSDSSCIYVENAKKVIITVEEKTTNTLIDGETDNTTDEPDGAIFSKDDLVINGLGTLNITANYQDGIVSKDTLKVIGTTINIIANDDGIRGKDYTGIKNANINITSNGDGMKSTNNIDSSLGYIIIEGGNIEIKAEQDGIQAETILKIVDGNINITTGGGSSNSSTEKTWGQWGIGKDMNFNSQPQATITTTDEASAKAIKANTCVVIEGGTFNINSSDDSIHSKGNININNGTFEIQSGDDGLHADEGIYIYAGNINIKQSYEGIEGSLIEINGGNIYLVASDDGINIAGGNDSSSINGRPGQNDFSSNTNQILTINGGYIVVDATGDGIDINGSGYINGGTIIANGSTNSGNGALDYDGVLEINGGTLIAAGASGMLQTPSASSSQYSISIVYTNNKEAGTNIVLKDENDNEIVSYESIKSYQSLIISTSLLEKNKTYTIYENGEKQEDITISSIVTSVREYGYNE